MIHSRRRPPKGHESALNVLKFSVNAGATVIAMGNGLTPLSFGRFEIRPPERKLLIDGRSAELGARAFDVLKALAERPGQMLTKNELLDIVWPNTVVDENNLQVQIHTLRKLLGPQVIATIPGRGYTFTATPVSTDTDAKTAEATHAALTHRAALALKTNLPERLPALIGRDDDLTDLEATLQDRAVITVVGAGGIGKTFLVQHLLDRQRSRHVHGVCFVEMASLGDPGRVVGTVAAALGVHLSGGSDPLDALVQAVAPLSLLLALDNAEHLLEEVARVAQALHAGAPQVTLVVTSQAPLQLDVEQVYRLGALALPEAGVSPSPEQALGYGAVALFVERARRVDRQFALSVDNVATVVSLCRRLDGLPLAIGLAAARVPLLGIEGLAAALDERLKLLTSSRRDVPAKLRTLRAALEWSHGLLDAHEQAVFRRLGAIEGSGSLELVRSVAADETLDEWTVLDALSVLVERSLVMFDSKADEAEPRYRLLESPRAYALEQLAAAGEEEVVRARHARATAAHWTLAFEQRLSGHVGIDEWHLRLEPDLDNARAAFAWSCEHDASTAVAVSAPLLRALAMDYAAVFAACDAVEPMLEDETVSARLRARAWLQGGIGLPARRALEWGKRADELFGSIDDSTGRFETMAHLAWRTGISGDGEAAAAAVAEMDRLMTTPDAPLLLALREHAYGGLAIAQQRWEDVLLHMRRTAELWVLQGCNDVIPELNVIETQIILGHFDDAVSGGDRLLARLEGTRWASRLSLVHVFLTAAWLRKKEAAPARVHAAQAWVQVPQRQLSDLLASHAVLLAALEERPRAAAQLAGYADALYTSLGETRQELETSSVDRAMAIVRSKLGEAEIERLKSIGAALNNDAARRVALGETDVPG
jgi:predicted ATPase/DNA-binding winged helix-turn-helix (wHTH) protein